MIKVKNLKKFKIFIIISGILLIVLVLCMIWMNISASEHGIKRTNLMSDENSTNSDEYVENVKKDNLITKEKSKEINEKEVESEEEKEISEVKTEIAKTDGNFKKSSEKAILVPKDLAEGEAYKIYDNTLIIGDSRIEGFKLYSGVKNASYFCMKAMTIDKIVEGKQVTINGENISVYDLLEAATYDKVIVGVGLNELGWNHIETFLGDYGQMIDKIKEKQPNASIYLQAVLPVSKSKNDTDKVHNNAQIYWYNENIIKLASEKGVKFVNPAAALVDEDGYLISEATTDGVHLNSEYCKVWAKYLAELV